MLLCQEYHTSQRPRQPRALRADPTSGAGFADAERPFARNNGVGYRAVCDLGDPANSVFVISTGQSGKPLSSHYEDYAEPWRDGQYLPMLTDRAAVEEDALGTRVLRPRGLEGRGRRQFAHFERRRAHHAFLPMAPHLRTMHGKDT